MNGCKPRASACAWVRAWTFAVQPTPLVGIRQHACAFTQYIVQHIYTYMLHTNCVYACFRGCAIRSQLRTTGSWAYGRTNRTHFTKPLIISACAHPQHPTVIYELALYVNSTNVSIATLWWQCVHRGTWVSSFPECLSVSMYTLYGNNCGAPCEHLILLKLKCRNRFIMRMWCHRGWCGVAIVIDTVSSSTSSLHIGLHSISAQFDKIDNSIQFTARMNAPHQTTIHRRRQRRFNEMRIKLWLPPPALHVPCALVKRKPPVLVSSAYWQLCSTHNLMQNVVCILLNWMWKGLKWLDKCVIYRNYSL